MASAYRSTLTAVVAGTGSSATLIASSAGQPIRVWQIIAAGTTTDAISIVYTQAGVATTIKLEVSNGSAVLPMSGAPWATADTGTAVTFTAAATTTVSAYYTKGA